MTALAGDTLLARQYGSPDQPIPAGRSLPIAASTTIYAGAIVARTAAGYAVPYSTSGGCVEIVGRSDHQINNGTSSASGYYGGAAGATQVPINVGAFLYNLNADSTITSANDGNALYASDDNTLSLLDGGGTRLYAGYVIYDLLTPSGKVFAQIGFTNPYFLPNASGGSAAFKVRAVATSIAAYAGTTTGVLTASATGAIGAQDGVTLIAGDLLFLQEGLTNLSAASDAGPYVVTSPGGTGVKYVLTRPSWWETGSAIVPGQSIDVSGEGTIFAGNAFKAMCGKSQIVDTNDAKFYARVFKKTITLASGTYTIGFGGGAEQLALWSTTASSIQMGHNTNGGTLGTAKYAAPVASRVAGAVGTAVVVINSLVDAGTVASSDTSTVDVLITNW